jgi:hypothetical protein
MKSGCVILADGHLNVLQGLHSLLGTPHGIGKRSFGASAPREDRQQKFRGQDHASQEEAGCRVQKQEHRRTCVPVEVVLAIKDAGGG